MPLVDAFGQDLDVQIVQDDEPGGRLLDPFEQLTGDAEGRWGMPLAPRVDLLQHGHPQRDVEATERRRGPQPVVGVAEQVEATTKPTSPSRGAVVHVGGQIGAPALLRALDQHDAAGVTVAAC